jgi:predicted ribosomally synthesized peptide with nif11-like leader
MSKANLEQLRQEAAKDLALKERLNKAKDNVETIIQIGQEKGYSFTQHEVEEYISKMNDSQQEISEEQLESVAGGAAKTDGLNIFWC